MTGSSGSKRRGQLGDFEIGCEIGRGGMGIVYEARQVSLNRKVALKVLAGSLGLTSKAVVRFRREAEAAAKLHHTNIVPIYATGESDGTHFYAMELVEGPSLNFVIRQMRIARRAEPRAVASPLVGGALADKPPVAPDVASSLVGDVPRAEAEPSPDDTATAVPAWVAQTMTLAPPSRDRKGAVTATTDSSTTLTSDASYFDTAARMIADVADALDYAHNHGVIHRDMKPSNLLLSPDGRLSINDFGLARMLEQPGMTMTGEFVGSPLYMSPEQIAVGRVPLDHRTDIYSLGATLYELLTLQPPFPGERRDQIIAQIIQKEPKPPRRHNRKLPVDLETICLKALEKDPDRRYQTASQMAEDLRRFVNRFAISAKRAGVVGRTTKWVRRRPAVAGLIVLVILVSGVAGLFAHRSHQQRLERIADQGQQALDQAVVKTLCGRYEEAEHWLERAEVYGVAPGRIRVLRGRVALGQNDPKAAVHELELAIQQLPESLSAHALLFQTYIEEGKWDEELLSKVESLTPVTPEDYLYGAEQLRWRWPERSMEWLEKLAAEHPTPAVFYRLGRLRLEHLVGSYDAAEIDKTLASLSAAKTQMPENVPAVEFYLYAHLAAADIYKLQGDTFRHDDHLDKAKQEAKLLLEQHPDHGKSHRAQLSLAMYDGRWEDAISHARIGMSLEGFVQFNRYHFSPLLYRLGRYEEALAELEAMPEELQALWVWCRDHAVITAELEGPDAAEAAYRHSFEKHGARLGAGVDAGRGLPHEIYCLLGQPEDAVRFSREYLASVKPPFHQSSYSAAVDQYICGELPPEGLLKAATGRTERIDAHYLVGLARLADGDRAGAIEHFTTADRAGNYVLSGYGPNPSWASVFLQRLREDPTWPPWIPVKEEGAATQSENDLGEGAPDNGESP